MVAIKSIALKDADTVHHLINELGYKIDNAVFNEQLTHIINSKDIALVALLDDTPVGYIHVVKMVRLTSPAFYEIVALVVAEQERRKGIGKKLVAEVLKHTKDTEVRVRCNTKREEAHRFYGALGFVHSKTQKVFTKQL